MSAATVSMNGVAPATGLGPMAVKADKAKELKMEILMEKLRSKTSQYKNLADTSKAVRMNMLDKRWAVDTAERAILQRCLDSLQHCIQVSSLQSLKERLECLSRQLGLKFMGGAGENLFISSDMFYLEILLEASGKVKDVKIQHEGKMEQQSCEELVSAISRGDFADFTAQLEGLTAVYQLNAEKKVKCKAFSALQSLEADLCTLGQLQAFIKEPWSQVHKSPIGFLQKRRGGHAMRLTYFVSPYELLDKEKATMQPLTAEVLAAGKPSALAGGLASLVAPASSPIGHSATVLLEGSTSNKLQVSPIISVGARPMGKNGPIYAPLGLQNSSMLPACFTLKLSSPMPLCVKLAKIIFATTEVECAGDWNNARPLLTLVVQHTYSKFTHTRLQDLNIARGLFVNLPDQSQCYFVCETRGLEGCVVNSVPFTHPSHVPQLLACLRQQALFNTLVASCVRTPHKQATDLESMLMFEMSALSWQHISISLEHPLDESMATVELDLTDAAAPRASVCTLHPHPRDNIDDYITKVLQKSHSIPITLRCLVKVWEREAAAKQMNGGYSALDNSNFSLGLGALDPGGAEANSKQEPMGHSGRALYPSATNHPHQGTYLSDAQQNLSTLSQDTMSSIEVKEEKKSKKRKSDGDMWPSKRGKPIICEVQDSDSDSEWEGSEEEIAEENSSNDERAESPASQNEFASDAELSRMEASEASEGRMSDVDNSGDGDAEDILRNSFHKSEHKKQKHKKDESRSKIRASSLLMELKEGKTYMPSSVSITPIGSGSSAPTPQLSSMLCLDRRPGIEIIPISSTPPAALPSSITITPISSSQARSMEERHRSDKKSSRSDERGREKKKKKRREDPMGPPDKLPPKQDPLTKPVSVSIKPTDGSPVSARSSSPNSVLRKFSPSPTHGRSMSITKSPSSSGMKSMGKPSGSSGHHTSPRHSPVQNSPKHLSGYSSPKNHSTSSPKHSSSGSGKPSMSALKSAAGGSPSNKSSSGYDLSKVNKMSSSKDGYSSSSSSSRDKEKKHSMSFSSSGSNSPKIKPTSVKLKQLEITPILADAPAAEPLVSPSNVEVSKSTPSQVRNRKGSLSAVIDKLKSAQHCGSEGELSVTKAPSGSSSKDRMSTSSNKFADSKSGSSSTVKANENKNSEYMVKPSSDGMKITINKTRTKESSGSKPSSGGAFSSSSSSSSSSVKQSSTSPQLTAPSQGSPKTHTGLKPGVLSGPASKKTQVLQSTKPSGAPPTTTPQSSGSSKSTTSVNVTSNSSSSSSGNTPKVPYSKSSSSSSSMSGMNLSKSMSSKSSSGSPKSGSNDMTKIMREREREKARMKSSGSNSEKSIFSGKSERSSPAPSRDEVDGDRFKSQSKDANFLVEGLIKPLDTSKFQIPKLKNQTVPDKSVATSQFDNRPAHNDFSQRSLEHGKYPFPHTPNSRNSPDLIQKSNYPLNVPKPPMNMGSSSPKSNASSMQPLKQEPLEFTTKPQEVKSEVKSEAARGSPTERTPYTPQQADVAKGFSVPKMNCEERKGADSGMKPPASAMVARSGATTPQEAAEMLLDFSSSSANKVSGVVAVRPVYAAPATSLALHLVKSPAPSPLVIPSPHSNSPSCITDDELMDEALVGPGK